MMEEWMWTRLREREWRVPSIRSSKQNNNHLGDKNQPFTYSNTHTRKQKTFKQTKNLFSTLSLSHNINKQQMKKKETEGRNLLTLALQPVQNLTNSFHKYIRNKNKLM